MQPIQTEKGEMILLEDLSLVKSKAKKRHSQMSNEQVTDIVDSGYVYSDTPAMKIYRNRYLAGTKVADISLGYEPVEYKENETSPVPKEIKFGDLLKDKSFTPAKYAARIASKFPTTDREKDAFAELANTENKQSRMPYLEILTQLSEVLKGKNQPSQYKYGGRIYQKGGSIHINPENKGKFTASANSAGMGVQEFAAHVLANREDYSPLQVKRANFARNATKFNHQYGGEVDNYQIPTNSGLIINDNMNGLNERNQVIPTLQMINYLIKNKKNPEVKKALNMLNPLEKSSFQEFVNPDNLQFQAPGDISKIKFKRKGGFIPKKAQLGELIGAGLSILDGLGIFGPGTSAKKEAQRKERLDTADINSMFNISQGNINNALGASTAGAVGNFLTQDTAYNIGDYSPSRTRVDAGYNNQIASVEANKRSAMNQGTAMTNSALRNSSALGLSPTQSMNFASQLHSSNLANNNNAGLQYNNQIEAFREKRMLGLNKYDDLYADQLKDKYNIQRNNSNQRSSGLFKGLTNSRVAQLQALNDLQTNTLAARMASRGSTFNAVNQANAYLWGNIGNSLNSVGNYLDSRKNNNSNTYNPGSGNYIPNSMYGPSSPANGYGPMYPPTYDPNFNSVWPPPGKFGGYFKKGGKIKRKVC